MAGPLGFELQTTVHASLNASHAILIIFHVINIIGLGFTLVSLVDNTALCK